MNTYVRSALLGATTGIRSTAGPFAARWSESKRLPIGSAMALGGEMVADKLPFVPSRATPGGLAPRVGGAIYAVRTGVRKPDAAAYAIAAVAAIGTAFAAANLRKFIKENTDIPDFAAGLAEDVLVLACLGGLLRFVNDA
ncbi:MAG: hypothetical protein JO322_00065 [Candidatus Eremiobacteraeota bacterium]|nr:hypothetical protein [Candidatus Eremiobacteraeota bacterium]